jgi:hypothetical protein
MSRLILIISTSRHVIFILPRIISFFLFFDVGRIFGVQNLPSL